MRFVDAGAAAGGAIAAENRYQLRAAGVRVPEPFGYFHGVLVMELVTDAEGFSAPRLGEVALVPHTVANTAFVAIGVGDAVNLEVDLVARYVERLLGERSGA